MGDIIMERKTKAVILSIVPGLGHLYLGFIFRGLGWMILGIGGAVVTAGVGLILIWPVCMIDAYQKGRHTIMAADIEKLARSVS